jgi:hypothetical protein
MCVYKRTVYWNVTLCSLVDVTRRFGGTYSLHHVAEFSLLGACNGVPLLEHLKALYSAHTAYLCAPYDSRNSINRLVVVMETRCFL